MSFSFHMYPRYIELFVFGYMLCKKKRLITSTQPGFFIPGFLYIIFN
ncbi:hypothetical protein C2W58_03469 [Bacillus pumilus]|uniref:Uncharacterized protein n=1 Tax=Bacillus pumilus TaxID=1408 RepID=A0AB34QQ31_BACPU|nr:hypothetical protein B4127_0549 [Bacillus pumilus]RAP11819.1 hypothetical protein C2W58_03469 [Bacillus pumilus]